MSAGPGLALGIDEGSGPLVVLLHGFPELPSSWRHQVAPIAAAGYRVVAPFLRGYGDSPAPADPAAYTADHLADDVAGVIEACGAEQAVVVGHDWGAICAWASAQLRPERVRAVAALSVPYPARSRSAPLARLAARLGGGFFYMLWLNEPGRAEREVAADVEGFLLGAYAGLSAAPPPGALRPLPAGASFLDQLPRPEALPAWLDADVLAEEVATFTRTGMTGPANYYRALDLTWERVPALGVTPVPMPALFLAGERDPVLLFSPTAATGPPLVPDLRADVRVPGAGHWVNQEQPAAVTAALLSFLAGLDGAAG